jgi:hypothetical protein
MNTPSSVEALGMPTPVAEPAPDHEPATSTHYFDGGADAVIAAAQRTHTATAIDELEKAIAFADSLADRAAATRISTALTSLREGLV